MTKHSPEMVIAAWPGLMTTETACAYTSWSEDSFLYLAAQCGVRPVECADLRGTRWRRSDLDRMIDSLPEKGAPKPDGAARDGSAAAAAVANDPAAAALEKAAQRARKGR